MPRSRLLPAVLLLLLAAVPVAAASPGDSLQISISRLDSSIIADPDNQSIRLERGFLHLAAGDSSSAEEDFREALRSKSDEIRARAHVGLGRILIGNPVKSSQAAKEYRKAADVDPACFGAIYDPDHIGYLFNRLVGQRVASEELAKLLCRDLQYSNLYRVWRDLAFDKRDDDIRDVDECLEKFLEACPDSASWWVDLARDRFYLDKIDLALETLDAMSVANPDYVSPDIPLLRARCYLENGDTDAFHAYYRQAIEVAESAGEFKRLFCQIEPLLYPRAYLDWEMCETDSSRADFFRKFWGALKPDPLEPDNPRQSTHYSRLRLAEREFDFQIPIMSHDRSNVTSFPKEIQYVFRHGKVKRNSGETSRAVNDHFSSAGISGELAYSSYMEPPDYGEDNKILANPLKFWFVGYSGSIYNFGQKAPRLLSYTMEAIQKQYADDEGIMHNNMLSYTRFRSADPDKIEVAFFHGGIPESEQRPEAEIAVFDLSWNELERRESAVYPVVDASDEKSWLAAHKLEITPGSYWFGVRTRTGDGVRWVERGLMELHPFGTRKLELSGVVLGSLPQDDSDYYSRGDIPMLPRPSQKFEAGEIVSVYLEVYNLGQNQDGSRGFTVKVDVTLVEDDAEKKMAYAGGTIRSRKLDPEKSTTSLNHSFDRAPESGSGPVAEFFTIDTSLLHPGNYRMVIRINDTGNNASGEVSCVFELAR